MSCCWLRDLCLVIDWWCFILCNAGSVAATNDDGMQQRQSPLQRSLQELIVIWLPHMIVAGAPMIGACYLNDSTIKMLLYSALHESQKNWISFGILWIEEVRFMIFAAGVAVPVWQLQVISFDLLNSRLTSVVDSAMAK